MALHSCLFIQAVFHPLMVAAGGDSSEMIVVIRSHLDLHVDNSLETVRAGTAVLP
jgi:hypothetical protein